MRAYFVYDSYVSAGRPKAEAAVMAYAENNYMHNLIHEDRLVDVLDDIKRYHDKILEENKRLSPVNIRLSEQRLEYDGNRVIHIGQQSLRLRRVKDVIE